LKGVLATVDLRRAGAARLVSDDTVMSASAPSNFAVVGTAGPKKIAVEEPTPKSRAPSGAVAAIAVAGCQPARPATAVAEMATIVTADTAAVTKRDVRLPELKRFLRARGQC